MPEKFGEAEAAEMRECVTRLLFLESRLEQISAVMYDLVNTRIKVENRIRELNRLRKPENSGPSTRGWMI